MPGEGPWLEMNARSDKDGGIGNEPNNPGKCSEATGSVTRQSEVIADILFYALYDKVYRKDVLTLAYQCSKANGGAAGVDDQTFEDIEAYGAERWLDELGRVHTI
jgi:hypothetical protein